MRLMLVFQRNVVLKTKKEKDVEFWNGLLLITSVHLLAAASPGPDFVMVTQQTLLYGKRTGLWVSVGIALGLGVHILYSILGLAATIANSLPLLWAIKLLGGAYLTYLGIKGLRARSKTGVFELAQNTPSQATPKAVISIGKGFACNVLNPKAPVYFVSLFTVVLSPKMPLQQLAVYGAWMMLLQMAWFGLVVLILAQPRLQIRFKRYSHWIDRCCGAVMVFLGVRVLTSIK